MTWATNTKQDMKCCGSIRYSQVTNPGHVLRRYLNFNLETSHKITKIFQSDNHQAGRVSTAHGQEELYSRATRLIPMVQTLLLPVKAVEHVQISHLTMEKQSKRGVFPRIEQRLHFGKLRLDPFS